MSLGKMHSIRTITIFIIIIIHIWLNIRHHLLRHIIILCGLRKTNCSHFIRSKMHLTPEM